MRTMWMSGRGYGVVTSQVQGGREAPAILPEAAATARAVWSVAKSPVPPRS